MGTRRGTDRQDTAQVTASVTVPMYQAGSTESRVREARQTAGQRRIQIEEVAPAGGGKRDSRLGGSDDSPGHHSIAEIPGSSLGHSA